MEKMIVFTVAALLITSLCRAQTEKGNQSVGLTIGYSGQNAKQTDYDYSGNVAIQGSGKENGFNIAPTYSYLLKISSISALQQDLATSFIKMLIPPSNSTPQRSKRTKPITQPFTCASIFCTITK